MTGDTRDRLAAWFHQHHIGCLEAVVDGVVMREWDDQETHRDDASALLAAGFGDTAALTAEVERLASERDDLIQPYFGADPEALADHLIAAGFGDVAKLREALERIADRCEDDVPLDWKAEAIADIARAALEGPADATGGGR